MYHPYFCKVPLAGNGSEIPVAGSARASSGVSDDAPAGKKPEAMPENGSKAPASSKATFVDGMEPSNGRNTLNETLGIKRTNPFVFNVSFNVTV
ncbi:hypothetical protein AAVH_09549 [Aphelenchoides avenae]|nr:hypothetical protein AAVH_09549 [Aphelenchus avenae]